jgi:hypothetical protein
VQKWEVRDDGTAHHHRLSLVIDHWDVVWGLKDHRRQPGVVLVDPLLLPQVQRHQHDREKGLEVRFEYVPCLHHLSDLVLLIQG